MDDQVVADSRIEGDKAIVNVSLCGLGEFEPITRVVEIPMSDIDQNDPLSIAEATFRWGQNDYWAAPCRSVSNGDTFLVHNYRVKVTGDGFVIISEFTPDPDKVGEWIETQCKPRELKGNKHDTTN